MQSYEVERFGFGIDSTLSRLWNITDGGRIPLAWCCEDERRDTKVFAETCIPLGTYELGIRTYGRFYDKYKSRYGHDGVIEVLNVPDFTDILWHIGNDDQDTAGCLLIGSIPILVPDGGGDFTVGRSADAYRRIYPMVSGPIIEGERSVVTYLERRPYA